MTENSILSTVVAKILRRSSCYSTGSLKNRVTTQVSLTTLSIHCAKASLTRLRRHLRLVLP